MSEAGVVVRRPLAERSVALAHEWFSATGGSENVFLAMSELVPHAEGFVLWRDWHAGRGERFHQSWLAYTPLRHAKAIALPFMPLAWRTLTRRHFDVVISSSHAFAHTVKVGSSPDTRYLSYVHSPARYLWSPEVDARGPSRMFTAAAGPLRYADVRLSRHVHSYAVNSREVQQRVRRFWHRDSRVIHPPVDVEYFAQPPASAHSAPRDYLLGVGRWIPYKRFDLILQIAAAAGLPVVLAGAGPQENALRRAAARLPVAVTFESRPSRERLRELYWGARALLFPGYEDFGIIPVEAMACGTPVFGLRGGGLCETVDDGRTGALIDSLDPAAYAAALRRVETFDRAEIQSHAWRFSAARFAANFTAWLDDAT